MASFRTHPSPRQRLSHGTFFGCPIAERSAPGFTLGHHVSAEPRIAEHEHAEGHFILVTSGHYVTRAAGESDRDLPLFLYNPPGTVHGDCFNGGHGTFFAISSPAGIPWDEGGVPAGPRIVPSRTAYTLARKLLRELARWGPDSPLVGEGLCFELHGLIGTPRHPRHGHPPRWVGDAWDILRDQSAEPITIADVAEAVGIHPVHLARTFRELFGASPGEVLRDWRVRRAARLLRESKQPICEVALVSGFADQSHFCKVFKSHYGVPPGKFRSI